jgi:hypothetical protein
MEDDNLPDDNGPDDSEDGTQSVMSPNGTYNELSLRMGAPNLI